MAAKKPTAQQQRDKRAKIMLGVLGAVLLLVLVIEVPSMLGGKKTAAPPAATTTTAATSGTVAPAAAPGSLASFNVVATPQPGQLKKFGRFASKNPFHAPAAFTPKTAPAGSGGAGSTPAKSTPAAPTTTAAATTPPPAVTFTTPTTTTAQSEGPMVLAAVLRMNGVRRIIPLGSVFPAQHPIFKLVAVGKNAMWISLLGGSFGNGKQRLEIVRNKPVKLVNTTASLNYVLRLLRMTTVPKASVPEAPAPATTPSLTTTGTTAATTTNAALSGP